MNSPDDFEQRLNAVEADVAVARKDASIARADAEAARTLAAGADRDVADHRAEWRAQTLMIAALRETQLEQGRTMQRHYTEIKGEMKAGMAVIVGMLEGLSGDGRAGEA